MTLNVHMVQHPGTAMLGILRASLEVDMQFSFGEPPPDAAYEVLIAWTPDRAHLAASPNLHTLLLPWTGVPVRTIELVRAEFSHLKVYNIHPHVKAVAEGAIALMLMAAKYMVPADYHFREHGDWTAAGTREHGLVLAGKTALVLGYGAIGQHVASVCQALGMQVMATRRRIADMERLHGVEIHPADALHALLPRADVLHICLPHTGETDRLIGETELNLLPLRAVLVNVGRGKVVDEAALYHALKDGRLYAAGLDVWYNYPTDGAMVDDESWQRTRPATYPFWELDNVVMSPHRTYASEDSETARMIHIAQMLNMIGAGKMVPNQVDIHAQY